MTRLTNSFRALMRSRLALLALVAILPAVLWAVMPVGSLGASSDARLSDLKNKIQTTQSQVDKKKGKENILTSQVAGWQAKIDTLQAKINKLQGRQDQIQVGLDRETKSLNTIQDELRKQLRLQLELKTRLEEGRRVLAERLFELYRADAPTLISVVLDSKGFAELLERSEFLKRIGDQDRQVITLVRAARVEATLNANRLATLEGRQRAVALRIKLKRDEVASIKSELVTARGGFDRSKEIKASALANVKSDRRKLEGALSQMLETQAKIEGVIVGGWPIRQVSGSMFWPVNGPIT